MDKNVQWEFQAHGYGNWDVQRIVGDGPDPVMYLMTSGPMWDILDFTSGEKRWMCRWRERERETAKPRRGKAEEVPTRGFSWFSSTSLYPRGVITVQGRENKILSSSGPQGDRRKVIHACTSKNSMPTLAGAYRRRCGSRSLVGWGLLRSYSGVYLGSIPIRGSGAVVVGYGIVEVTGVE